MASTPLQISLARAWRRLHSEAVHFQRQGPSSHRELESEFHIAFLPILRKLIVEGVDGWFLPWQQLGDQIFSNCDEFGRHEEIMIRLTVSMDLDGKLIAILSQDSPGNLAYAAGVVRCIQEACPPIDHSYPCPLFRDVLTGVALRSVATTEHFEFHDVLTDPSSFVEPLRKQCITHGRAWTPRVEVLDTTNLNREVEVMLGQFADLWRISRPGLSLPPMLVGRGSLE
jgi:hypothetical protein